eukprot:gb/GFBE01000164.1/.p1 GENE.gb/GFBE01000164.1/~~gb/GFBE01000164.1/.p1  ORF type:complete len:301 (+),score=70.10 gb/GFBE01000164.1/:1-903(+)
MSRATVSSSRESQSFRKTAPDYSQWQHCYDHARPARAQRRLQRELADAPRCAWLTRALLYEGRTSPFPQTPEMEHAVQRPVPDSAVVRDAQEAMAISKQLDEAEKSARAAREARATEVKRHQELREAHRAQEEVKLKEALGSVEGRKEVVVKMTSAAHLAGQEAEKARRGNSSKALQVESFRHALESAEAKLSRLAQGRQGRDKHAAEEEAEILALQDLLSQVLAEEEAAAIAAAPRIATAWALIAARALSAEDLCAAVQAADEELWTNSAECSPAEFADFVRLMEAGSAACKQLEPASQ